MTRLEHAAPVVIGAGLAGLMTALTLAEHEPVTVLSGPPLGSDAATGWAQGGVAAAVGAEDTAELHVQDTLAAGDGLCDPAAAARITARAPEAIARLARLGARFDVDEAGRFRLGLEAAHGRRRIVHAQGDGTGREILRALVEAARRNDRIALLEGFDARRLLLDSNGAAVGVLAADAHGRPVTLRTGRVVIATGGVGGLFAHTTNPRGSIGRGLALAARVGAALADMEFVQFHPTALDVDLDPMPLVSEAVRGEGAVLVNALGERFMAGFGRAELEPRDVVARAVWAELAAGRRAFLDARRALGDRFAARFPSIDRACRAAGVDPAHEPIPIRPAAHYHMGGIAADAAGRSTVPGLWACGEAACTGLHGANRLASNSLLEAAVCAQEVAESVAAAPPSAGRTSPEPLPPAANPGPVRWILQKHAGVLRDRAGLESAIAALAPLARSGGPASDPALVGLLVAAAALKREESRGGHFRTDFPAPSPALARRAVLHIEDVLGQPAVASAA